MLAAGAGLAGAGLAGATWWWQRGRLEEPLRPPEPPLPPDPAFPNALRVPGADAIYGVLDAQAATSIVARSVRHSVLAGRPASLLGYEVEHQGRTLLNPTLRARTGSRVNLTFWNALDDPGIIHWHGFKVDSNNDGHPHYAVPGGATYDYQFTIPNRAGMYWYHPHPHGLSGQQIYRGMAGLFIVEDAEELALRRALDLRPGATDIPLIVQDRRLDADGNPVFAPTGAERFHGYLGDQVLVNLTLNACQAIDGSGHVVLRSERAETWQKIEIVDDGCGVAPELATKLFGEGATQGRIMTHLHGTDSYFVASLRRKPGAPATG